LPALKYEAGAKAVWSKPDGLAGWRIGGADSVDSEGGEEDDVEEEDRVEGKEAKSDREPFDITSVAVKVDSRLIRKNTSSQTTQ
jgi:hypothetical protein